MAICKRIGCPWTVTNEKRGVCKSHDIRPDCIRESCGRDVYGGGRGLCMSHFSYTSSQVKKGKTTWEDLEKKGLALPKLTKEKKTNWARQTPRRKYSTDLETFIFIKEKPTEDWGF